MIFIFTTVLFDLDGTLSDSFPGVSHGIEYALERLGYPKPEKSVLWECMGPPLMDSFTRLLGLSEAEAEQAVKLYREYYPRKGILEQSLMEGAKETLIALKALGITICLATSKPQIYSEKILKDNGIEKYFDVIVGATFDGSISEKADIIACVLEKTGEAPENCLMVGDRNFDVTGAHCRGVKCAGVLCGYGSEKEFLECGADYIVKMLPDIVELIRDQEPSLS